MKLRRLIAALAVLAFAAAASAQYPTKPVRIINPFAVGGGGDIATRIVAQKVSENTAGTPSSGSALSDTPGAEVGLRVPGR